MAKVLLTDDDDDMAEIAMFVLESLGHDVRRAHDGEEGLRMLREELPDVILLDVEMPQLDGPGMAYRAFLHNAGMERVPIVLLSGVADLDDVARRVGTPYFLPKPFAVERFRETLDRALSERRAPVPLNPR